MLVKISCFPYDYPFYKTPLQNKRIWIILNEVEALTLLAGAPLLGPIKVRLLVDCFASALQAIEAGPEAWRSLPGFGEKTVESWHCWAASSRWRTNLALIDKHAVTLLPYTSPDYPEQLAKIPDAPIVLYVKGDISLLKSASIAVVGTRTATIYGIESAEQIASELTSLGYTVVSGLARGIDTHAHVAALRHGTTLAVIGSGLANIYPRENLKLADDICKKGALISEYPMATPPDRQNFPQRNRIVSGLSHGVVLIEAPLKSGAMLTMQRAMAQERPLFALPGRADSPTFQGNLSLLKRRAAHLIQNGSDVEKILNLNAAASAAHPPPVRQAAVTLDDEESLFLALLPNQELSLDKIVEISNLPVKKINILLMSLLLKCAIKEYPGKIYRRLV